MSIDLMKQSLNDRITMAVIFKNDFKGKGGIRWLPNHQCHAKY